MAGCGVFPERTSMTLAVFLVSPVGSRYDLGGVPGLTCREPV
jgi:hypothetical protein